MKIEYISRCKKLQPSDLEELICITCRLLNHISAPTMNFSFGMTMSNDGMVIRNGNQLIRIGGNGISVSGGGMNVQMDGMGINIQQNGQRIMVDDRGVHIKNDAMHIPRRQFQHRGYEEDEAYYEEDRAAFLDEESIMEEEEDDGFEIDSFEGNGESEYYFSGSQQGFEDIFPQNFIFPNQRQYFQQANLAFVEEMKQEEPKLTQKQIEKLLPLSVYTEEKTSPKPNNLYFSRNRESVNTRSSKFSLSQKSKEQDQRLPAQPTSSQVCAVCIVDYKKGDLQRKLTCNHKFHKDCIDKWLVIKNDCPVCKTKAIEF